MLLTTEIKTSGMIIKETKVGEGNKIFTILTADHGKIQASGAGVRSFKSKLGSGCSLFCYTDFVLKKGKSKDIYNIVSSERNTDFFNIRYDVEKLSLVNYICDLANFVSVQESDCSTVLRLLLNTIYYIDKNQLSSKIKPVFELRLMVECGYAPNVTICQKCGNDNMLHYFSPDDGAVECALCHKIANIHPDTLVAMNYICTADLKSIFSFEAEDFVLEQLKVFAEEYVLHQIGNIPKSLIYLKSL